MATILHLHTILDRPQLGISKDGKLLIDVVDESDCSSQQFIHRSLGQIFSDAGLSLSSIDAICTCIGPGSYTSLRIGLSASKGLSWALRRPHIGISSLRAMCYYAETHLESDICWTAAVHARNKEYYVASFLDSISDKGGASVQQIDFLKSQHRVVSLSKSKKDLFMFMPHHKHLYALDLGLVCFIDLAEFYFRINRFDDLDKLEPLYIRNPYI